MGLLSVNESQVPPERKEAVTMFFSDVVRLLCPRQFRHLHRTSSKHLHKCPTSIACLHLFAYLYFKKGEAAAEKIREGRGNAVGENSGVRLL